MNFATEFCSVPAACWLSFLGVELCAFLIGMAINRKIAQLRAAKSGDLMLQERIDELRQLAGILPHIDAQFDKLAALQQRDQQAGQRDRCGNEPRPSPAEKVPDRAQELPSPDDALIITTAAGRKIVIDRETMRNPAAKPEAADPIVDRTQEGSHGARPD